MCEFRVCLREIRVYGVCLGFVFCVSVTVRGWEVVPLGSPDSSRFSVKLQSCVVRQKGRLIDSLILP